MRSKLLVLVRRRFKYTTTPVAPTATTMTTPTAIPAMPPEPRSLLEDLPLQHDTSVSCRQAAMATGA